jgi:hypothetical protein
MARNTGGRIVTGKLLQDSDGIWREQPPEDFDLDTLPRPQCAPTDKAPSEPKEKES